MSIQPNPPEQREDGARREHGGQHRERRPDEEHEGEAAHAGGRHREQHHRRDRRHDVRVDDRREALLVALRDRRLHRAPAAHLFLDAFEDDDVRVGRNAERQHEAGEARERQRDVEEQDRGVQERRVDAEPDDGHDAEEAVEDQEEDRDEQQTADRGFLRLVERVLAECRRDIGARQRLEGDGERTGLEDDRDVARLVERLEALDLRAPAADATRERAVRVVDLRERADLAVEDDREVLRLLADAAARPLVPRDLFEPVRAAIGELHGHDRPPAAAGARVEVGACPVELQVLPGHLRDVRGLVLEEVVVRAVGDDARSLRPAGADDGVLPTSDDDHLVRNGEHLALLGPLGGNAVGLRLRVERAVHDALRVLVEDVVRARRALCGLRLDAREQRVQRRELDGLSADRDRRARERRLEVVELEPGRLPDDVRCGLRVAHARKLDDDLVVALRPDFGLGDSETVDAAPHDLDGALEVLLGQIAVRRRNRLQRDLESSLEVEPQRRTLLHRRSGNDEQRHADQRSDQKPDDEEG